MVDSSQRAKKGCGVVAVHQAGPGHMARAVISMGPLSCQQRLGFAILALLPPVRANGVAAVVPDDSRWRESNRPAALPEPPAEVDIVASDAKLWIESADPPQALGAEGHVAPRDVLRLSIRGEHVNRPARGVRHEAGDETVARRRDVRPADRGVCRGEKARGEILEPVGIGVRVVVDVRDDLPSRRLQTDVARGGQAVLLSADDAYAKLAGDGRRAVGRTVVDDDHLDTRIVLRSQARQAVANCARAVVGADDHRDARPWRMAWERKLGEHAP